MLMFSLSGFSCLFASCFHASAAFANKEAIKKKKKKKRSGKKNKWRLSCKDASIFSFAFSFLIMLTCFSVAGFTP